MCPQATFEYLYMLLRHPMICVIKRFVITNQRTRARLCKISDLIEHSSETLISRVLGLLFLLLLGLLLGGWSSGGSASSWGSSGVCVWVGDTVLELLNLGPAEVGGDGNGQDLLVAVDNGVHNRGKGWEVSSQGDSSNGGDGAGEGLEELGLFNIQNAWGEGVAIIVNLADAHTVGERRDVQHVEQSSLGSSDLGSSSNKLEILGNFNGTTGNLGWDTESLEERGLSGFHTSVTGWDEDIIRSNGTSSGGSSDLVLENLVTDGLEILVGENESDVALDVWEKTLILWGVGDETLDGTTNLQKEETLVDTFQQSGMRARTRRRSNWGDVPWCSFPSRQHPLRGGIHGSRASAES